MTFSIQLVYLLSQTHFGLKLNKIAKAQNLFLQIKIFMQKHINGLFFVYLDALAWLVTEFSSESPESLKNDSIAARLRHLRIKSGVKTDHEFAKLAGVSRASMSQYLNGRQIPRPPILHRIAQAMNIDINWLLGQDMRESRGAFLAEMFPEPIFDETTLDAPVNFYLLLVGVQACREAFEGKPKPSLRETLKWIAAPYALHSKIFDSKVKMQPLEE